MTRFVFGVSTGAGKGLFEKMELGSEEDTGGIGQGQHLEGYLAQRVAWSKVGWERDRECLLMKAVLGWER